MADRLIVEYAGAVPAGQVLAMVVRTDRLLRTFHPEAARGAALCEELVRHQLAEHIAGRRGAALALSS